MLNYRYTLSRLMVLLLAISGFQLGAMILSIVGGELSYMGHSSSQILRETFSLYWFYLLRVFQTCFVMNVMVTLVLALPFCFWPPLKDESFKKRFWISGLISLFIYMLVIGVGFIKNPSAISNQNPELYDLFIFKFLASQAGFFTLITGAGLGFFLFILSKSVDLKMKIALPIYYSLLAIPLYLGESQPSNVRLPEKSVVILMADSFRSEATLEKALPYSSKLINKLSHSFLPSFTPPIPRTAPSLVSLFTSRLPSESRVTTMFSPEETFDQTHHSVVTHFRNKNYCSLVFGEYPAEMLHRIDLNFQYTEVPLVRFKEISGGALIEKLTFSLASLLWWQVRKNNRLLKNLAEGLPTVASPNVLIKNWTHRIQQKCGDRPSLSLLFFNQPHFPYTQTFPHYWGTPFSYEGSFRYQKHVQHNPKSPEDKKQILRLYNQSKASSDHAIAELLHTLKKNNQLKGRTVYILGDHGESLYDEGRSFMGHGDHIEHHQGNSTFLVTIPESTKMDQLIKQADRNELQTTYFPTILLADTGFEPPKKFTPTLPPDTIYLETGLWMMNAGHLPPSRVNYPGIERLLTLGKGGHLIIKNDYRYIVEYAKNRSFFQKGNRYQHYPKKYGTTQFKNKTSINTKDLPVDFLKLFPGQNDY